MSRDYIWGCVKWLIIDWSFHSVDVNGVVKDVGDNF